MSRRNARLRRLVFLVVLIFVLALGVAGWIGYKRSQAPAVYDEASWNRYTDDAIQRYADLMRAGETAEAKAFFMDTDDFIQIRSGALDPHDESEVYEKSVRRLLRFREKTVGPGKYVADSLLTLIRFYEHADDHTKTVEECDRSLERIESGFGANSPPTQSALLFCGNAMVQTGDVEHGEALLARARHIESLRPHGILHGKVEQP